MDILYLTELVAVLASGIFCEGSYMGKEPFLCHILVLKVEFIGLHLQCVTSQISEGRQSEVVGLCGR